MEDWCKKPFIFGYPDMPKYIKKTTKWDDVDFSKKAPVEFWKNFRKRELPTRPSTPVNVERLRDLIHEQKDKFTVHQKEEADLTIKNLVEGAQSFQVNYLRGGLMRNAASAKIHGATFTEVLSTWLDKEFVAGPFLSPPLREFRANSLMAEVQRGKVRPILNMSYPEGESFNDNIDKEALTKVRMSSAKQFGQTVLRLGGGSVMTKIDMKDAYKNVPSRIEDLRLQGFHWLGACFVETQQIFGSAAPVANFDNMANTILNVVLAQCEIPRQLVHRTLDDTVCVTPTGLDWGQQFSDKYKEVCGQVNVKLAEDCPRNEKAFTQVTRGTVLGIQFDTNRLAWRIASDKRAELLANIHTVIHGGHVDLKQIETTAGRMNNFGQMCPFLQAYKRPLNDLLAAFREDYSVLLEVSQDLILDLRVWAAVVAYSNRWLPIPREVTHPPTNAVQFVSDAAGGQASEEWTGVASLGISESGGFWFMARGKWPRAILQGLDEKGARFCSKMTTLELAGLFMPLLSIPNRVRGKNVILGVDNTSVVFAWQNKSVSGDLSASVLVRALHLVSCFLETRIFVQHIPRCSTLGAIMADSLTRSSTAKADVWAAVTGAEKFGPPAPLWEWLENPVVDWQLGHKMVDWLKDRV